MWMWFTCQLCSAFSNLCSLESSSLALSFPKPTWGSRYFVEFSFSTSFELRRPCSIPSLSNHHPLFFHLSLGLPRTSSVSYFPAHIILVPSLKMSKTSNHNTFLHFSSQSSYIHTCALYLSFF